MINQDDPSGSRLFAISLYLCVHDKLVNGGEVSF